MPSLSGNERQKLQGWQQEGEEPPRSLVATDSQPERQFSKDLFARGKEIF